MREIKFRVWNGKAMTYPKTVEIGINGVNGLTSASYQLDGGGYCTSAYVMQFTGVSDRFGEEIYEGDIVNLIPEGYTVVPATIQWADRELRWICYRNITDTSLYLTQDSEVEVIGNIYDNPELLKEVNNDYRRGY